MDLPGPRKTDPPVHLRRILVYSPANADGQAKARARKLAAAAEELDRLVRTAGTRFHPTAAAVPAPAQAIPATRRGGAYHRTPTTRDPARQPAPTSRFAQPATDPDAPPRAEHAL